MEAYKRRMVIEYQELKERAEKLAAMLDKWENGELDFMPKCPEYLLREQLATMKDYIGILQTRAKIEGVDLTADVDKAGWIPVTERLPEKSGRYLVTRGSNVCGSLWNKVDILNYSDLMGLKKEKIWWSGNVGKSDFEKHDDVLAWIPLPEPYKA